MKYLLILTILLTTSSYAKTLKLIDSRLISLEGGIDKSLMAPAIDKMEQFIESRGDINILINSNGGSISYGLDFIQLMDRAKARGIRINCLVTNNAMSMGFAIFAKCDKRYAFSTSKLLWHKGRQYIAFGVITSHSGGVISHQLKILDTYLDEMTFDALKIKRKYFNYCSNNDIVHTGQHLKKISPKFMTIVDDYRIRSK